MEASSAIWDATKIFCCFLNKEAAYAYDLENNLKLLEKNGKSFKRRRTMWKQIEEEERSHQVSGWLKRMESVQEVPLIIIFITFTFDVIMLFCRPPFFFSIPTGLTSLVATVLRREAIEDLFEDGTVSFLGIASIRHGFKTLSSLTVSAISRHTRSLALYTRKMLSALRLRHGDRSRGCIVYGSHKSRGTGFGAHRTGKQGELVRTGPS
ncbi:hypothetical protein QN277_001827 [Acacia crassicarpa]|uniref:Uncharacterized protein n=1 Tax=Acacia crassicarpa TaxID=499986 RepID=A0AAE1N7W3_9FABA|nr:hypothetical protein QN277_001827 [Acacia crassicarpa]